MRFRTKGQAVMQVKDVNVHFFSYFYLKMVNRLEASFCLSAVLSKVATQALCLTDKRCFNTDWNQSIKIGIYCGI